MTAVADRASAHVQPGRGAAMVVGRYSGREYRAWAARCTSCAEPHFLVIGHGTRTIYGQAAFDDVFECPAAR